jgi:hypothetical protein
MAGDWFTSITLGCQLSKSEKASDHGTELQIGIQRTRLNMARPDIPIPTSARWRFQTAMILAVAADALQVFVFPFFAEGALSPADDILDLAVAAVLVRLVGWHWEFLPAFAIELVPGVDLVPFWTLAVANVYRKWKQKSVTEETRHKAPVIEGEYR